MTTNLRISLIVPCYNEEENITNGTLDRIANYTQNDTRFMEVILVDDGSTDKSKKIIKEKYLSLYPKLKLIENSHAGKAFAIITGIKESKYEQVMFSDFDLATPIEESEKLMKGIEEGYHVVIGSRNTNREGAPIARKILALGFIITRNLLIGLNGIKDTQCGFKIFDRNVALEIIHKLQVFKEDHVITAPSVSAGFDIEFLFIAKRLGCKIKEVPVQWHHVKTERVNFIKDAVETIHDILNIRINEMSHKYDFSKKNYIVDLL